MSSILLDKKDVIEYISDSISEAKLNGPSVENARFHHNTEYRDAVSICRHGILTLLDLNKYGIRKDSKEFLMKMNDIDSHVNGNDCVSLSVVDLTDLYPNEVIYNPFMPNYVDFLVTSNIKVGRNSTNYGNEYLSHRSITREELRAIDIRLLKLIRKHADKKEIIYILNKYNHLLEIAKELEKKEIDIPLREMSEDCIFQLDTKRLSNNPKLAFKKEKKEETK